MVTDIREVFHEPNGIVINPTDWGSANFRLAKDANDQYFAGGLFTGQDGTEPVRRETFWGLDVVVTPAIAAGTVLVGDFSQAQIFRKGGVTMEASTRTRTTSSRTRPPSVRRSASRSPSTHPVPSAWSTRRRKQLEPGCAVVVIRRRIPLGKESR